MSYATRRPGNQQQNVNTIGNIGQRRPVVSNNFIPGGTVAPGQVQAKPVVNQAQQQRQPHYSTTIHFRNQPAPVQAPPAQAPPAQAPIKQESQLNRPPQPQNGTQQSFQPMVQQQVIAQPKPEPPAISNTPQIPQQEEKLTLPVQQQPVQQEPMQQEGADQPQGDLGENENIEGMNTSGPRPFRPRKPWFKRNLPRREMIRRRNIHLSKILKPKNAVAVVNELIKDLNYDVSTVANRADGRSFKASVLYDGITHEGFGFTEDQAKNGAAEVVLKHYIKVNKPGETGELKNDNAAVDMEVEQADENAHVPLSWQHVASFAIYKLFSQWEEDPNLVGIASSYLNPKLEHKSSKKMPPNPEAINPLMLLNQMKPLAKFEEIGCTGTPPHVLFSFRCTVDDQNFVGTGTSKKNAKRNAAYAACYKVLGITYPPDVWVPSDFSAN